MGNQENFKSLGESAPHRWWIWALSLTILTIGSLFIPRVIGQAAIASQVMDGGRYNENTAFINSGISNVPQNDAVAAPDQAGPDLSIIKSGIGDFEIGPTEMYSISVKSETGPITGPITVTDVLTDALGFIGASGQHWNSCGFDIGTRMVTCVYTNTAGITTGVSLPPIMLSVQVVSTTTLVIDNTATVTNTSETDPSKNSYTDTTNIIGADLAVTKTVAPSSPLAGSTFTYTISLSNLGPSQATGVLLTDTLPADVTFVRYSAIQGTYNTANGVWNVGSLANGAASTLRVVARVNNNAQGKTVVNSIEGLSSDIPDYNASNNTASVSFIVPGATQVRGLVTDRATNKAITGALVELQDTTNRLYSYTTAANGWYTFTSTITNPIAIGSATIRASKIGYVTSSTNPVIVQGQSLRQDFALDTADLLLTKSDGTSTVLPGQTLTYTLVISNIGTLPAASVVITDVLPPQISYISDTSGITHSVPSANTYVWKFSTTINPASALRFKIRTNVSSALPSPTFALTNLARATTKTAEANTSNNVAQDTNASTGTVNPGITISVSPTQVKTNQNATYSIKLTNTGTAPVTAVTIEDTFSSFVDISSAKTTKGTATTNNSTRKVTVTIDVLKPNEEVTITVVVRVNTTATTNTTVTNSASMKYTFGGSSFTRNSNSVSFQILATSTLPGTGGIELSPLQQRVRADIPAFSAAALTGLLCLLLIGFAFWARQRQPEWSRWAYRMGLLLGITAVFFGLAGWGLRTYSTRLAAGQFELQRELRTPIPKAQRPSFHTPEVMIWPDVTPQIPGSELDKLPEFPIPTPTTAGAAQDGNKTADISPVNRIIIPALALDTVVKYVPFDGITWLIAGLQQEVAWMGDTSWPGLGGNTALAGHVTLRTGVNGPFRYISDLRYGDIVFVHTDENIYEYQVRDQYVVEATDLSVLEPSPEAVLTFNYLHRLGFRHWLLYETLNGHCGSR